MFSIKNIINWIALILVTISLIYTVINYKLFGLFEISTGVLYAIIFIFANRYMNSVLVDYKKSFSAVFLSIFIFINPFFAIPILVLWTYIFRYKLGFLFFSIVLTIVLLLANNLLLINLHSPFIVTAELNISFTIFILISIIGGWFAADNQEIKFFSGILLFILFLTQESTFHRTVTMVMAEVILISSIKKYKVDRFLGKIYE
ncbi:MAG: hypothetical protein K9J16_06500 [Melioribacteraceae bacterium]|nr:hypothetical protein [Melioribacteraceae bacterium]MCF8353118.1 hypothetical protein [Melioribacteraceae bacterium]MCF8392736.1 hypothetical protein [Melioribacteraceae bacterium]MCF8418267.1 hypothetical protein [Melioribacteraceae bacterium]